MRFASQTASAMVISELCASVSAHEEGELLTSDRLIKILFFAALIITVFALVELRGIDPNIPRDAREAIGAFLIVFGVSSPFYVLAAFARRFLKGQERPRYPAAFFLSCAVGFIATVELRELSEVFANLPCGGPAERPEDLIDIVYSSAPIMLFTFLVAAIVTKLLAWSKNPK